MLFFPAPFPLSPAPPSNKINFIASPTALEANIECAPRKNRLLVFLHKYNSRITAGLGFMNNLCYGASAIITRVYLRTASAAVGVATMFIGLYFNQPVQSPDEIKSLREMPNCNYAFARFKHAFQPKKYPRQSIALGYFLSGIPMLAAGIQTSRYSEIALMADLTVYSTILAAPVTNEGGWAASSLYALVSYTSITAYNIALTGIEADWLSLSSAIFGLASVIFPLAINSWAKKEDIKNAHGFKAKAIALAS